MVIWLIGLSGAGKTTIGKCVYREWKKNEPNTVLVDGDEIRELFSLNQNDSDYSLDGRRKNAERCWNGRSMQCVKQVFGMY